MIRPNKMNRREFLTRTGLGTAALLSEPVATSAVGRPTSRARRTFAPDLEIALQAASFELPLLPGAPTRVWGYKAEVLHGDPASLQTIQDPLRRYPRRSAGSQSFQAPLRLTPPPYTYLGPIIRARRGQRIRINFTNDLPEQTVMHWHGLHVAPEMDAHPRYLVNPGQSYVYEFEVTNRAGTYWFHPHPDGRTALQVHNGLAGLFIVSDGEESDAGLPSGRYDIPLVIQDRSFDAANQFVYQTGGGMTDSVIGFLGIRYWLMAGQTSHWKSKGVLIVYVCSIRVVYEPKAGAAGYSQTTLSKGTGHRRIRKASPSNCGLSRLKLPGRHAREK